MFVASAKSRFSHDVANIVVLIVAWMSLQNEKANKEMMDVCSKQRVRSSRARGYKTFFMLNSVEHEILTAH